MLSLGRKAVLVGVVVAGLMMVLVIIASTCTPGSAEPTLQAQFAAADDFPLVWAGEQVDFDGDGASEMQVSAAGFEQSRPFYTPKGELLRPASQSFWMTYGDCKLSDAERPSCPLPLTITVYPPCFAPVNVAKQPGNAATIRGVRGDFIGTGYGSFLLETADFTVLINAVADSPEVQRAAAVRVAESLRGANALASSLTATDSFRPKGLAPSMTIPICEELVAFETKQAADYATPPPLSSLIEIDLFIDANGATNGTCNEADASATVPSSATAHSVQICLAGNSEGNVDAVDLRVGHDDALLAGVPEIDCPAAGGGTNCVDDNPDLNDGLAALGTGWSCTAFGTSQPRADDAGPGVGHAVIQCNAAITSPSALLQNGLLATLTLDPIAPGAVTLELGASGVTRQGAPPATCADGLSCAGATVTVQ